MENVSEIKGDRVPSVSGANEIAGCSIFNPFLPNVTTWCSCGSAQNAYICFASEHVYTHMHAVLCFCWGFPDAFSLLLARWAYSQLRHLHSREWKWKSWKCIGLEEILMVWLWLEAKCRYHSVMIRFPPWIAIYFLFNQLIDYLHCWWTCILC